MFNHERRDKLILMENIKSEFEVVIADINNVDTTAHPMCDVPNELYRESSKYELECKRICKKHGWSLEEFDAEVEKRLARMEQRYSEDLNLNLGLDY